MLPIVAGILIAVAIFGLVGGLLLVLPSAARRLRRLDNQLADILNIVAGTVRTGSSLFQALDRTAREAEEPSRTEFLRVVRAISLGAPLEVALQDLARRMPTEDIEM